jgi:hypothetical protein
MDRHERSENGKAQAGLAGDDLDRIRFWSTAVVGAVILNAVGIVTLVDLRIRILSDVASVAGPICLTGLIWKLHSAYARDDRRSASFVTSAGLLGVSLQLVSSLAALVLPGVTLSLVDALGPALIGLWLLAGGLIASRGTTLDPPVPRRGIIGGIGFVLVGSAIAFGGGPFGFLWIAGLLLTLNFLGFLLGLTRIEGHQRPKVV